MFYVVPIFTIIIIIIIREFRYYVIILLLLLVDCTSSGVPLQDSDTAVSNASTQNMMQMITGSWEPNRSSLGVPFGLKGGQQQAGGVTPL